MWKSMLLIFIVASTALAQVACPSTCELEEQVSVLTKELKKQDATILNRCSAGVRNNFGSSIVADHHMTASSTYSSNYPPHSARLDNMDANGAWIPEGDPPPPGDWLQIDFLGPIILTGIVTQGRPDVLYGMQYVTTFKVSYGTSPSEMKTVSDENGKDLIFDGNYNNYNYAINFFPEPISARYVRFITNTWVRHPAVRLEYLTC